MMGARVVIAPGEAEAECARLCTIGAVDAVMSEDMDSLAFGSSKMLSNISAKGDSYTIINRDKALALLGFTSAQFVDLCILLGSDYTGTLPGIGPKRALSLMQKYGSIQSILQALKIGESPDFNYSGARAEFESPRVVDIDRADLMSQVNIDIGGLRSLLVDTYGLVSARVDKVLATLSAPIVLAPVRTKKQKPVK
jgi:flap endonuclease-1